MVGVILVEAVSGLTNNLIGIMTGQMFMVSLGFD
jgi:hypothetical protein